MKKHFALGVLAASLTGAAHAQLSEFSESFDGADLGPITELGPGIAPLGAGGRWDAAGGVYVLSPTRNDSDDVPANARLRISTGGTLEDFNHEVTVDLVTFFTPTGAGSSANIVLKAFGPDGFSEVVVNSFGNLRVFHNPASVMGGGDVFFDSAGVSRDAQSLTLRQEYRVATNTLSVLYSIDGGAEQLVYSGTGFMNAGIGNIITNAVEVEVSQFGDGSHPRPVVHVSSWSLGAPTLIPEPGTYALLAGCFGLVAVMLRRR